MSKGNTFENDLLLLIFQATPIADLAADDQSSPLTSLFVSLHEGDPGDAGNQSTSEVSYPEYLRVAVARTSGGWAVASGVAAPEANIDFAQAATSDAAITHFGVGTSSGSGAAVLLYSGAVTPNINIFNGVTPRLTTASTITED